MKLNEVTMYDKFFRKVETYSPRNNRFELFDRNGVPINEYSIIDEIDFAKIDVIETVESYYSGYGVGYKVLHIKVDLLVGKDGVLKRSNRNYGVPEVYG